MELAVTQWGFWATLYPDYYSHLRHTSSFPQSTTGHRAATLHSDSLSERNLDKHGRIEIDKQIFVYYFVHGNEQSCIEITF
jgi:hypothetical protein